MSYKALGCDMCLKNTYTGLSTGLLSEKFGCCEWHIRQEVSSVHLLNGEVQCRQIIVGDLKRIFQKLNVL